MIKQNYNKIWSSELMRFLYFTFTLNFMKSSTFEKRLAKEMQLFKRLFFGVQILYKNGQMDIKMKKMSIHVSGPVNAWTSSFKLQNISTVIFSFNLTMQKNIKF